MYERILVAVDGGPSSELAIAQAVGLAKQLQAEVKVLFVVDDSELFFEHAYIDPTEIVNGMVHVGQKALAAASRRFENAGVRCLTALAEKPVSPGNISGTIVSHADQWQADLIVMGTHGRRGMRRVIMGSVSEGVISKSAKPVLLIRGESVH
ncbi:MULTISPECIES: universal stress protein [Cupriavidus]|uniref:Universal stress protein n=1 Tax=Cupriavidus pauculus TaxID=82633 RepID=A0A3G8H8Z1_9BURK|nr:MULTISPECIES: universal stress protein [Cupriavidus]AZG16886.1 universal stress protein [Cupriavidus pauculus]MDT6961789.1 universal stress protein [Cupriavidus sp. SZY C1]